jgi:hypothetical protein
MPKQWWKSKTVWLGILTVVAGLLDVLYSWIVAGDFSSSGIVLLVSGAVGVLLRFLTTQPVE